MEVINSLSNQKAVVKEYLDGSQNTDNIQDRLKSLVIKETAVLQQYYNVQNHALTVRVNWKSENSYCNYEKLSTCSIKFLVK